MPLNHSKSEGAFKENVSTLMKERGKSPHVKDRSQALAIAYSIKRGRANGGRVHEGPIVSAVPGRTDHHPMDVAHGSYVLPAHVVSGLGQGNTLAGMEKIKKMFPDIETARRAHGGKVPNHAIPIAAAGGEVVLTPEQIIAKYGSLEKGHKELDEFCKKFTKKLAKQISKLPPPARD